MGQKQPGIKHISKTAKITINKISKKTSRKTSKLSNKTFTQMAATTKKPIKDPPSVTLSQTVYKHFQVLDISASSSSQGTMDSTTNTVNFVNSIGHTIEPQPQSQKPSSTKPAVTRPVLGVPDAAALLET
jgi:hypothetical protein